MYTYEIDNDIQYLIKQCFVTHSKPFISQALALSFFKHNYR